MARQRATWPTVRGGGRVSYPWPEWLDGSIWFLERGKDYTCSTNAMRSQYGMRANRANLKYRTQAAPDDSGLYVQTLGDASRAVLDAIEDARGGRHAYACPNCGALHSAYNARELGGECHSCRVPLEAL